MPEGHVTGGRKVTTPGHQIGLFASGAQDFW